MFREILLTPLPSSAEWCDVVTSDVIVCCNYCNGWAGQAATAAVLPAALRWSDLMCRSEMSLDTGAVPPHQPGTYPASHQALGYWSMK